MAAHDPKTRVLVARAAALTRWAHEDDRRAATQPATDGFLRRFLDEVDPERSLPTDERNKRAECARRAYFTKLALKRHRKALSA